MAPRLIESAIAKLKGAVTREPRNPPDPLLLRDLARDACLSRSLNYAYIPIGKAANTNIKRWLWQAENALGNCGAIPEKYFDVHNKNWRFATANVSPWQAYERGDAGQVIQDLQGRFVFTVVRNPYSRLLSGYRDKIERAKKTDEPFLKRFCLPHYPASFEEFVEIIHDQPDEIANIHFRAQSYCAAVDFISYGAIAKLEDGAAMRSLQTAIFGNDESVVAIPHKSSHASNADELFAEYYSDRCIRMVNDRFEVDFRNFGYDVIS